MMPVDTDNGVDEGVRNCLVGEGRGSFITFAGAGSGKTYSLKEALDFIRAKFGASFAESGKQVAVITFTNNAADEIKDRVERSSVFAISTIHSFCWSMISGFNEDIRKWYRDTIPEEIASLQERERRGRSGAASEARQRSIERLEERLQWLSEPRMFVYDPNGVNTSQNSLSHADVLKIFASFAVAKPLMSEILANKFPFIFVDESQDTDRGVMNAIFQLQTARRDTVCIGLFGDTMQRIFGGGEAELGKSLPVKWVEFDKKMNHRSARRIVGLGNQIRKDVDGRFQFALEGAADGFVRFFLLPHGTDNKEGVEEGIRLTMAGVATDDGWNKIEAEGTAVLLLEHKMVSRRLGFSRLVEALSKSGRVKDRLFEGENGEVNFFSRIVLPLAEAGLRDDSFEVMSILRSNKSPLLEEAVFEEHEDDPLERARLGEAAFRKVVSNADVTFLEVLKVLVEYNLLEIPRKLRPFVDNVKTKEASLAAEQPPVDELVVGQDQEPAEDDSDEIDAWTEALGMPFSEIYGYRNYIDGLSVYRTHQGVKGNEFERVMVVMDDDEAGGFSFSYEQYFGAKKPSAATLKKMDAGEETGLDRTRRLFYVTSTRAKRSLAHVIYTSDVAAVRTNLIERGFAKEEEVIIL